MNQLQRDFLDQASQQANKASHPYPQMAACEAALESAWGNSQLAKDYNNLFGMKQHAHPLYSTVNLPTHEVLDGKWIPVTAQWVNYPDWASCFADRKATLERLSNVYPHYAAALAAMDAKTYVYEVSQTWSTDPNRAQKCIDIYNDYLIGPSTGEVT